MQLFKDIAAKVDSAVDFQIFALIVIFIFFVGMVIVVMNRPKGYYKKVSELPLNDQSVDAPKEIDR